MHRLQSIGLVLKIVHPIANMKKIYHCITLMQLCLYHVPLLLEFLNL